MKHYLTSERKSFTVRIPSEEDAQAIIDFARQLFASTDQVLTTPEEYTVSLEEEKIWINRPLKEPGTFILIAETDNRVIGLLDFTCRPRKKVAHTGEFGISVHPDYQGKGVGKTLIQNLLIWAKEHPQIEKVFLNVFATNAHAIKLYSDLGFVEEGRHINAIKQSNGEYVDLIQMYQMTK